MAVCTITGTIKDVSESPLTDIEVTIDVLEPRVSGTDWISAKRVATTTDSNGNFTLDCVQDTEARITIFMPLSNDSVVPVVYIVQVPAAATANFEDLL